MNTDGAATRASNTDVPEYTGTGVATPAPARVNSSRVTAYVMIAFVVLSALLIGMITRWDPLHNLPFSADAAFYLWTLKWWPHALLSLHNPFYPPILYPPGQTLAWMTSVPTLALLAAPITLLAGPILALNALNAIGLATNGVLAYLIAKGLGCNRKWALVGGLLFYFSSYTWGQLLGHLALVPSAFALALVYVTIRRVQRQLGPVWYVTLAAALLALQFGVSNEVYATLIFFSAVAAIVFLLSFGWNAAWRTTLHVGVEWVLAICGSLVLVSPYLYEMFTHHTSNLQNISYFVADPINYLIPTQTNWLLGHVLSPVSSKFIGNASEQDVYLGLPMVALLVVAGRRFYSNRLNRALLITLLVVVLCSFGPRLTLLGIPTVALPWHLIAKLPLIGEALPSRFGLYTSLLAAILVARALTAVPKLDVRVLAAASVLFVLPNVSLYWSGKVPHAAFFSSDTYKRAIPRDARVLVLPTYEHGGYESALWQAQSNFWFAVVDGPAPTYARTKSKYAPLFAPGGADISYGYDLLKFIRDTDTQFVLTNNEASDGLTLAFRELKFPSRRYGNVSVSEVIGTNLRRAISKMDERTFATACNSLANLASVGTEYVSHGSDLALLTPSKVANAGFDARFGTPLPAASPAKNWTSKGYWLGGWGDAVAVGVSPIDGSVAQRLYASFSADAKEIYFPYPRIFHGEGMPNTSGQILVVLNPGSALPNSCKQ